MFESPLRLVLGLAVGVVFGFLLQKGRVAKHGVIVGQLLLRDFTVVKIMLTAVAVGAAGFWVLVGTGVTSVDVKPAQVGGVVLGALLFGGGLALLGYCPGTTVAAVGEGRRDAMAGLAGMLSGAAVFVAGYATLGRVQEAVADWGAVTLPQITRLAPAAFVIALLAATVGAYLLVERRLGRPKTNRASGTT
jgi:uncharacterized protein